jgi:hypothetical protein
MDVATVHDVFDSPIKVVEDTVCPLVCLQECACFGLQLSLSAPNHRPQSHRDRTYILIQLSTLLGQICLHTHFFWADLKRAFEQLAWRILARPVRRELPLRFVLAFGNVLPESISAQEVW